MYEFCKLIHGRINSKVVKTNTMTVKMKHETTTVVEKLDVFCFSLPDQISSDQSRQFESALIAELCNVLLTEI